ncbi:MAG TPA: Holliday junction branch migration DNA helicase RuvB [Ignavibacteria bacterium]|nr:Holliday junction branch migration DNA helicase RuvB [Ignavibacteria bacterium]HRF66879.1 Holliday junction branch migration DNA helicase RuvB [Ignavibacteria bacterium]HRJ03753.1 Holliday junction branch migration DNA helicase RuvB [Ignavibacteria bacterium]HRJ86525.1 Holliday junction branch migration DNA helicase RuvB [Ignavibacteria bacterium]
MAKRETEKISAEVLSEDREMLNELRPHTFKDFTGQEKIKTNVGVSIASSKKRGDSLDHVLFTGPPGLGKTTLAYIIAAEMNSRIITTSGPVLEKPGDIAGMLTKLQAKDILFIDEIHRIPKVIEEYLYSAMEDYKLDIIIDQGPGARSVSLQLEKFTLIGSTTRAGLLSAPLLDRFGINCRLKYYNIEELADIVNRSAGILKIRIEDEGALIIAKRSRGTPRIANRLLKLTRDLAIVKNKGVITAEIADEALNNWEIDHLGLDELDKKILTTIIETYKGGPVGLNSIAVSVGEEPGTIEEVYEPFLVQEGFIRRTSRGREATDLAYRHLGITKKAQKSKHENGLFDS